jgi:hypothetical protein
MPSIPIRVVRVGALCAVVAASLYAVPARATHCEGLQVYGGDLVQTASSAPAGTTFCLHSGQYDVTSFVPVQAGDRFIGESSVFVTTSNARQVFKGLDASDALLQGMDISGAKADDDCKITCGRGIYLKGLNITLQDLYVHHNENTGAAGMEQGARVLNSEFAFNGTPALVGCCAGAIKVAAQITVTGSYIHHNTGNGVWQDVCGKNLVVTDNTITWQTRSGVRYEHNKDCAGSAVIQHNTVQNNNTSGHNDSAGVRINSAPNADVGFNTFGGNGRAGASVGGARGPVTGTVIHDNTMNGDNVLGCGLEGVTCTNNV